MQVYFKSLKTRLPEAYPSKRQIKRNCLGTNGK